MGEPDAETTKNDMDTPCIESKSENIDIIQIENKIIERKESVSSTVEEMISSSKQLDEAIKQLEETTCVKESEILNQEDEFIDKLSSEDRSELVSQPSNNGSSHTTNINTEQEQDGEKIKKTSVDSKFDETKENIENLKDQLEEKSSAEPGDDKETEEIIP